MMKWKGYHILLLLFYFNSVAQDKPFTFKVMAWNILHGANDIENGPQKAVRIIKEIDPDVILMVETYGSGKFIADALGFNFHLIAPEDTVPDDKNVNLSIISRFPFGKRIDTDHPFYLGGREIIIENQAVNFFSNWFHYEPWHDEPENMGKTTEELLAWEKTGIKYKMIQKVLPCFKKYAAEADLIPLIIGGDMNTPSHLDWGKETGKIHNDLIVPWYSTKVLEDIGLIDSYREMNPDPLKYPGITWDTKNKKDEHRIDYIFYKGTTLKAVRSEAYKEHFNEPFEINGQEIMYPSDHGFIVTTFQFYKK
ncbi:endonuclease/exonuclease/phosphatase family protein [Zhouia spongiae]|uniref:Endonuclease/exonuclease/phosphatase family protein n=1 Tax=Zhouia spongiae TaxID=2202721 RepID=A0ABY3YJG8_9FLAO|nr:endonuclease/exonuclease/phosphatase family protein [Zhouia spongiae]UNY97962.1 endonuclease/exonuclease/phosphatase family protein [Zhouia spongiae]